MIRGFRRGIVSALLILAGLNASAEQSPMQLAFLRAAPEVEVIEDTAPQQSQTEHAARESLGKSNFYDLKNPDYKHLQDYDRATATLPKDGNGFPDWMRALRDSSIQPRTGLKPNAPMNMLDLDVVMKNTKEMPFVRFPHYSHTLWLDCSNCHPAPFEPKAGSTPITMADIFRGKYCGMCHDRVAFITFFSCQRCHSVPQPGGVALPK
jgi:c(7)-type cytochrome triheme protein